MWITTITFLVIVTSSSVTGLATNVRLVHGDVDGLKPYEGAVEVSINGRWGTILQVTDENTTKTICKILGFGYRGFSVQRFAYPGTPLLNKLQCLGNETSISQCKQEPSSHVTTFWYSPGIHCFDHVYTDIRLIPDTPGTNSSGSVQVKMDGRWGLLCDYDSDSVMVSRNIDKVLCRSLGYETNDNIPRRGTDHGVALSWIDMAMTTCNGTETSFSQCQFQPMTIYQPRCYAIRGVTCKITGLATDVRLVHGDVDGLKPYEGAVQVFMDGQWGPILQHGIDDTTTKTICKILGFGYRGFRVQKFSYPGPPLLNKLYCSGNETSISQCKQEPSSYQTAFSYSSGIHCFDHVFTDIRLVPDTSGTSNSGSVQFKMDGRWGVLCDYDQAGLMPSPNIDKALCKSLGYETNDHVPRRGTNHGVSLGWIDIFATTCNGTETSFSQCQFQPVKMYQPGCYAIRGVTCITTGVATNVRLVHGDIDGLKPYEGAVEVSIDGQWGPILRHGIDDTTAKTICKILGFGYRGFSVQRFAYPGTPLLNNLQCLGNETSISQCKQEPSSHVTTFWDSPGIHCFDHVYTDIRLIPDTPGISNSGSIQVKMDGRWGLLCDYDSPSVMVSRNIDKVLCRSLGYETNDEVPRRGTDHGVALSWIDMAMTTCNGTETSFSQCQIQPITIHQPRCSAIRGVTCIMTGVATNVRLVHGDIDGLKPYEGAVEVYMDGQWGPILRHGIDENTTKTICKILGFGYRGFSVQRFAYPGTPLLNKLQCLGNETSISQCKQEPSSHVTTFWDSPGIHCFDHVYTDIRLIPDTSGTSNSGSVQVKMDGRWGLLCDYDSPSVMVSRNIDKVLCRSLGYERNDNIPRRGTDHGVDLSWIDMDMTICNGTETSFSQCQFQPMTIHQPRCPAIRGVTCITKLNGSGISGATCVSDSYFWSFGSILIFLFFTFSG